MLKMPEFIEITPNNYSAKLEDVYNFYKYRIAHAGLKFMKGDIVCRKEPLFDDKDECFWHLITKDSDILPNGKIIQKDRNEVDFRRIERLKWCPFLIENHMSNDVYCWEKQHKTSRGKQKRIYLWDKENSYVVVLAEDFRNTKKYQLITAYPTDKEHTFNKFDKEKDSCSDPRKQ